MTTMTGGAAVVRALLDHGLSTMYCLPGVQNDHLFNAVFDVGEAMRVIHTRHEQGAAYMALGAALATGKPSLFAVVPGPGFLNTTAALATAYSTGARVLCLTGQIPSHAIGKGQGFLHEIPNQLDILRILTKWAERIERPEAAPGIVAEAVKQLISGRPRPVGIEIPPDILAAQAAVGRVLPLAPEPEPALDEDAIERAAALLRNAEHPLILAGGGAMEASEEVRLLAETLGAPVIVHRMGRGVLDTRHPLSQNMVGGHALWRDCDVVLAIGTRAQAPLSQWGVDRNLKIIKLDIDAQEMSRIHTPDIALVGHAATVLRRIREHLPELPQTRPQRVERSLAAKAYDAAELSGLQPQMDYLQAIRDVLPDEGVLVEELTQVGFVGRLAYEARRPRTYISSGYQGTLGWGVATALGVKDALGAVPVVSIVGDGGFMFNVQELATAVRHRIPLVIVLFNDNAYGNVRRMQQELYGNRVIASDLANPDFMRLAESFGIAGMRAHSPDELRPALEKALGGGVPTLIEVPCGSVPSPWKFLNLPKVRG